MCALYSFNKATSGCVIHADFCLFAGGKVVLCSCNSAAQSCIPQMKFITGLMYGKTKNPAEAGFLASFQHYEKSCS